LFDIRFHGKWHIDRQHAFCIRALVMPRGNSNRDGSSSVLAVTLGGQQLTLWINRGTFLFVLAGRFSFDTAASCIIGRGSSCGGGRAQKQRCEVRTRVIIVVILFLVFVWPRPGRAKVHSPANTKAQHSKKRKRMEWVGCRKKGGIGSEWGAEKA
jgi:hypothetical protein